MNFVDTHCHPHFDDFTNPDQVLGDAVSAGVTRLIAVGTTVGDSRKAIKFAGSHANVWASAGVHPHDAKNFNDKANEKIKKLLKQPKVIAIGEIGLDYYKLYSTKTDQQKALHAQIKIGLEVGLPFIFHVRDAWEDFWEVFDCYCDIRGVVHSFSADPAELNEILSRELHVGLNGIMTFTKDAAQLEAAKLVPKNRLLLETDAPFLTPAPDRGQLCEPKHILDIAKFLADLRGETVEELAGYTTKNAQELFKI